MSLALSFHELIEKYNVLHQPTKQVDDYLKQHPALHKAALIANHLFRAASMVTLMQRLPLTLPKKIALCIAGSLFYRLTVEVNCAYKFALPAMGGALAYMVGKNGLEAMINGVAFASFKTFAKAFTSLVPLTTYFIYITLTISYDVDHCSCQAKRSH